MTAVQVESVGRAEALRMPNIICLGSLLIVNLMKISVVFSKNFEVFTIAEILAKLLVCFSKLNLKCFVVLENCAKS